MVALQQAEMRMVRWICGIKLNDRFPSKELRERLGIDDIALVLQQNRLCLYFVWACDKTKRKTKEDLERGCQRGLSGT